MHPHTQAGALTVPMTLYPFWIHPSFQASVHFPIYLTGEITFLPFCSIGTSHSFSQHCSYTGFHHHLLLLQLAYFESLLFSAGLVQHACHKKHGQPLGVTCSRLGRAKATQRQLGQAAGKQSNKLGREHWAGRKQQSRRLGRGIRHETKPNSRSGWGRLWE